MEKGDKGSTLTRMGVSGWMLLLVPAYPGCPGQTVVKWLLLLYTYKTMKATRSRHGWVHMFITHCLQLSFQLHNFDLFSTCHASSFCTVAWQLARFQLTQRIARSLGDSWASCNKSVFSLLRRLSTWRYRHFLLSARAYWTAQCSNRSISPAGRALSSKPAASRRCCRSMGQTDWCTDCRHTKARAPTVT